MSLKRGAKKFHELLTTLRVGQVVPADMILKGTEWSAASLTTYVNKNKLARFLRQQPDGDFLVLRAGPAIPEREVERALTQVNPTSIELAKGQVLVGESGQSYQLTIHLGNGAVGHVWEAQVLGKKKKLVAVKVVNPRPDLLEPTRLNNIVARFRRESRNGKKLKHPNVVVHVDHGEYLNVPFLVMELAERSWADVLATNGPQPRAKVAQLLKELLDGLNYLHGRGCVHRDIKPANFLITPRGTIIGDLGIVRWPDMNPDFTSAGTLTTSSTQLGSWYYMAPEQLRAPHEATAESDVYALGVSWLELLTGNTLEPAAFGAGEIPEIPVWPESRAWIRRMTSYSTTSRPTISELIEASGSWAPR